MPNNPRPLFALNSGKTAYLAHDGLHWLLAKRDPNSPDQQLIVVAKVMDRKETLLESIRKYEIETDTQGRRLLAAMEDDFWSFFEELVEWGPARKVRRLECAAKRIPPIPARLVLGYEKRMENIQNKWKARDANASQTRALRDEKGKLSK